MNVLDESSNFLNQLVFLYGFRLVAAAASEPEASEQGSSPNFVLWVEIKIFYLANCMTVPDGILTVVQRGQA